MELELIRYFVKVVQNGSFSKAALMMKVPKSTVSKAVARLERETGTKLLLRTTRNLTLTAAGRVFFEASVGAIQTLEDAKKSLSGKDSILTGPLKITAPEDLGSTIIAPAIAELSRKHPGLQFELVYTDEVLDLVKDGYDIAFRIGKLNESSFKAKRMHDISLGLVASPEYLKKNPKIKSLEDLSEHNCLTYRDRSMMNLWILKSKKGHGKVNIEPKVSSNQMTSLMKMAVANGGIALVPLYICKDEIESGKLVNILPEWKTSPLPLHMVTPLSVTSSARLKITADWLFEFVQKSLLAHP